MGNSLRFNCQNESNIIEENSINWTAIDLNRLINNCNNSFPTLPKPIASQGSSECESVMIAVDVEKYGRKNYKNTNKKVTECPTFRRYIEQQRNKLLESLNSFGNDDSILCQGERKKKRQKKGRGSWFRGVAQNGRKWQVQVLGKMK